MVSASRAQEGAVPCCTVGEVGLHFCPFLRALGQTITMLDHCVNYAEKTKIVTERQPYLRSRPLNSECMYDKQDGNKTPPIVVG